MAGIQADQTGIKLMLDDFVHYSFKIQDVDVRAANILKQEALAQGAEAAVHRLVVTHGVDQSDVLLTGTIKQYKRLIKKLRLQPFGLKQLAGELEKALAVLSSSPKRELNCRGLKLPLGERTLIMGILNVTPDSFSDGGQFNDLERAVAHARQMVAEGADIIDIGAESTRPGHEPVNEEEELRRLLPVLEALVQELKVPVSIDTYKSKVARAALETGAQIINDIWGFKKDPRLPEVVAGYPGVPVIIMHNQEGTAYRDLLGDLLKSLRESIKIAEDAGINDEQIVVDPGIGFGKDLEQNLEVMRRLEELKVLGLPVLLGTSRKSMIGKTLDLPVEQRVEGTAATVVLGIAKGVDLVRVHDVREMTRVARMTDAMVRPRNNP